MTEAEWLRSNDPVPMLAFLRSKASDRKLRLFACACYYPVRDFYSKVTQKAINVAERFADDKASPEDLNQAFRLARGARSDRLDVQSFRLSESSWETAREWADDAVRSIVSDALQKAGRKLRKRTARGMQAKQKERRREFQALQTYEGALWPERKAQSDRLRDIFGNPFRPAPSIPSAVLRWNDGIVCRIAECIYEERRVPQGALDAGRLAILHDALLDAGCDDEVLLSHCRNPEGHVRGCWALDLLLGKE